MKYAWIINKDHTADETSGPEGTNMNAVGVMGPSDAPELMCQALEGNHELLEGWTAFPFKMYDDDGELYYEGHYICDDGEPDFGPLDDFGAPNAGATEIRYKNAAGKWETL